MPKGSRHPSGVGSFTYGTKHSKGKKVPATVGGGREDVKVLDGTSPSGKEQKNSGSASSPAGVNRGDGTENRGTTTEHHGPTRSSYATKPPAKDRKPSSVAQHSGK